MATIAMRRPAASPLRRQETRAGLIFILPWLISLLVFTTYPVLVRDVLLVRNGEEMAAFRVATDRH